jgi:hypothetical protein
MKTVGPTSLLVAAAVCAAFLGAVVYTGWQRSSAADENNAGDSGKSEVAEDPAHFKLIAPQQRILVSRIIEKQEIARALLRGDVTFHRAADRFRELSSDDPAALDQLRIRFPGASDAELWHRQVIGYVQGFAHDDSARVAALVPKLEAEVARRFPRPPDAGIRPQSESTEIVRIHPPHYGNRPGARGFPGQR